MPEKTHVLLGITGGIAAYKIPNLCSRLVKGRLPGGNHPHRQRPEDRLPHSL